MTGQRADGYHLLESLVAFADVGDRLWLAAAPDMSMQVSGRFAAGVPTDARNLAWRAAQQAGWTGHVQLEKNLPHGAGIGGGSADAAAVLRALNADAVDPELGADVPVCRVGRASIMSGIGEQVQPLPRPLPPIFAVLVNPGVLVPTPAVFAGLARKDNPAMDVALPVWRTGQDLVDWLQDQRNDLEAPAMQLVPAIGSVLQTLRHQQGCQLARMSGSGATCFAIFADPDEAQRAARSIQSAQPDWWCVATALN